MRKVAKVPEKRKPGRPADLYPRLFQRIIDTHGVGVSVIVREYRNVNSAGEVLRRIDDGRIRLPGGRSAWDVAARRVTNHPPRTGSRLYATWKG